MASSHILSYLFVIVTLVFIASADGDGGYKLLEYDEDLPARPWQNIVQRAWNPRIQRRQKEEEPKEQQSDDRMPDYPRIELDPNKTDYKRKSSFEKMNEHNNFQKDSGVKFIYGRMPMPVILVATYPKPKH